MKLKAFTLIEVIISITLFSIILLFMYKTLDMTNFSNKIFEDKIEKNMLQNTVKQIIVEDILEASSVLNLDNTAEFSLLEIQSNNMYHDVFYKYIYYLVSREKNLLRIESLNKINFKNLTHESLKNAYVDLLLKNIEIFSLATFSENYSKNNAVSILLKQKITKEILITSLLMAKKIK